jgi:PAS domain S-box-containing protein
MKNNVSPTRHEKVLREQDFVVSKTDTKGRITYANQIFYEYSGYTEEEMMGAQHNIVRHPDMPRGVFKFLWDTLATKQECFAYVKNMSKDGSFYWVFANVTPSFDATGQVIGYFSVRRKPRKDAIEPIADLYRSMLIEEQKAGARDACSASLGLLTGMLTQKGVSYESFILAV